MPRLERDDELSLGEVILMSTSFFSLLVIGGIVYFL